MITFFQTHGQMGRLVLVAQHDLQTSLIGGPFITNKSKLSFGGDAAFLWKLDNVASSKCYTWILNRLFGKGKLNSLQKDKLTSLVEKIEVYNVSYHIRVHRKNLYVYIEDFDAHSLCFKKALKDKSLDIR